MTGDLFCLGVQGRAAGSLYKRNINIDSNGNGAVGVAGCGEGDVRQCEDCPAVNHVNAVKMMRLYVHPGFGPALTNLQYLYPQMPAEPIVCLEKFLYLFQVSFVFQL